jgi:hypothetical protein
MARNGFPKTAIVTACSLLVAAGVSAQKVQSSPPAETVTVLGVRKADEKALMDTISQFVDQHAARDRKSGLLVRDAPAGVCPVTLGLPDNYDQFVTARVVDVARKVGAGAQEIGNCHANIEIIFTNKPQDLVTSLSERTKGLILGFHYVHERGSMIHVYRPIQAWYVTGTRDDSFAKATIINRNGERDSAHASLHADDAYGSSPYTGTGSRITPRNGSQIVNALIVADLAKVGGTEIGPIADYIAMLALSQPDSLDACNPFPSILDLMSGACSSRDKPAALTSSDMAYLKALYEADITTSGQRGSDNVAKGMNANLTKPPADKPPQR